MVSILNGILYALIPVSYWLVPVGIGVGVGRYFSKEYFHNFESGIYVVLGVPLLPWYIATMFKGASLANLIEVPILACTIGILFALRGKYFSNKRFLFWYAPSCYLLAIFIGLAVPSLAE
jgi:hypothetical protein